MTIFKDTEVEKAIQFSLEQAAKEFGTVTQSNKEEILDRGFEILQSYRFQPTEDIKYDSEGKVKLKTISKVIAGNETFKAQKLYSRMVDFSKLPIKNPFFHKADRNKFVKACRELFPNVDGFNVGSCLTTFRQVIENIYYNLGFEGLKPQQICFYQFSALGGTGKSLFLKRLESFLKSVNIPSQHVIPESRWVGSEYGSNLVGFVGEFFPLRGIDSDHAIRTLNNIIDNTEYRVEYKGQDSYFNHSRITLFINSNKIPFDTNTRRYGIVRYNELPFVNISKEDKEKYFYERDWNKLFMDAFESCPFGETFEDIECKNSETLNDLIYAARDFIQNASDTMLLNIQDMTIRQFVSNYYDWKSDFCRLDTKFIKEKIWQFTGSLRKAVALGVIQPSTRVNGNMAYSKYNWQEIANMLTSEDDIKNNLNDIDNPFERTRVAFDNFLETPIPPTDGGDNDDGHGKDDNTNGEVSTTTSKTSTMEAKEHSERTTQTLEQRSPETERGNREGDTSTKSETSEDDGTRLTSDETRENQSIQVKQDKLSDGWLFDDYFFVTNEKGEQEKCFKKCETENKGQRQVCVNKPKAGNTTSRKNEDVLQENFLFEIDPPKYGTTADSLGLSEEEYDKQELKKSWQKVVEFDKQFPNNIVWICYSGNKSIHVVLRTNCSDPKYREYIFDFFNNRHFNGKCDKQCKNAGRLARNPNAVRENGAVQKSFGINENAEPLDVTQLMKEYDEKEATEQWRLAELKRHFKQWTGTDNRTPLERLKCIVTKTQNKSGLLALEILENGGCASGENMIGAIGYLKKIGETIDPCFSELAEECKEICHNQHPSNITK